MPRPKARKKGSKAGIGRRLRSVRLARGMTLRQVERATGVGVSHLSQIENDLRNVNVAKLEALAACYGCTVAQFFPRKGEPEPDIYQARPLTPTQREVLKAMEDDDMAEHLLEQSRMKAKYKASLARRRGAKEH